MSLWLSLAILAQLIAAVTVLVDKYVLLNKGHIGNPVVYAFYVSILSGAVLVLVPFGYISVPSLTVLILSLATACAYIVALVFLYRALKDAVPSDVMPVVGAIGALTSFLLGHFFLNEDFPRYFALSFTLLIVGTLIISHFRFTAKMLYMVVCAGVLFGLASVLVKFVFVHTDFINGFFWSRVANVVGALLLLLIPSNYHALFGGVKHTGGRLRLLVIVNKALSGVAFILTLRAIHLGSVTVVNALAGLQFIFLFLFAFLFMGFMPQVFRGEVRRPHELLHKSIATIAIVAGMAVLFAPGIIALL